MPQISLTEVLDNLYTTTWQNMRGESVDNIFNATPFWFWLRDKGHIKDVQGGRFLTEAVRFAKSDNIRWVTKGVTTPLADKEFLTIAQYQWRYVTDSIVRFGIDDQQNRGKNAIQNLMEAKLENSKDSLADELETRLVGSAGTNQINGLQDLVADDPTTGSVGAIDPATYTWWRNKTKDLTGLSFATHGVAEMRTMYNNVQQAKSTGTPDIIVTGQTPYEYYEDDTTEQKRIINMTLGDAGFQNIQFKGTPIVWLPALASGTQRMYFLNTRFLFMQRDPMMNFDMTDWKPIPDQINDRVAQIIMASNLTTSRRLSQGVIFNIDTQ